MVKVTISIADHHYLETKDIQKVSSIDLFSKLGGILNLWAGITLIVIVELAELMFRLCKRKQSSPVDICMCCFCKAKREDKLIRNVLATHHGDAAAPSSMK